jgi:hypothetical protein
MAITTSVLLLFLWFRASVAATTDLPTPTGIEVDVVFPRNTTYNNMVTPPIAFALQNAPFAVFLEYRLDWELDSDDAHFFLSGSFDEVNYFNKFNYTTGTTALLVDSSYWNQRLDAGHYTLSWEYTTTTCDDRGDSTIIRTGDVASGDLYFTVVEDGSGSKVSFEGCPEYLGNITAKAGSETCPSLIHRGGEPQPCKAKLNEKQIKCLDTYFEGQTDMKACEAAFDDIKPGSKVEWKYANETRNARSHASDPADNSSGSSSNTTTQNSSEDRESTNESGDASLGNTYRPHLGLGVLVTLVVGMLLS